MASSLRPTRIDPEMHPLVASWSRSASAGARERDLSHANRPPRLRPDYIREREANFGQMRSAMADKSHAFDFSVFVCVASVSATAFALLY